MDDDRSHEIKRGLPLGRKAMTNLDTQTVLKSKGITLPTKVHTVKAMVLPGVMYRCESWTIKRAERRRIDAFELWCWRRLLRVPWTARSNQSILKEINSIFIGRTDAESPILLLLHAKSQLIEKDPDAGKDWKTEEKGTTEDKLVGWYHRLNAHELNKLWEITKDGEAWSAALHGVTKGQTWLSDWTTPPPIF